MSDDQSKLVTTWADVETVIRAKAAPKWLPLVLSVLMALLLVGGIVLGITVKKVQDEQSAQKQGAIASCESGNLARATNVKIWDEFLSLMLNNPAQSQIRDDLISSIVVLNLPPQETQAFKVLINRAYTPHASNAAVVKGFEAYIAENEKQQDCQKLYSTSEYNANFPG